MKLPVNNPTLVKSPKASQLAAAILMHERGYEQRAAAHKQELVARLEAEKKAARNVRLRQHEKGQGRVKQAAEQRKQGLAKKFKLGSIAAAEWKEVEAEIETQTERRERKQARVQLRVDDPAAGKQTHLFCDAILY